jgi:hypothetical protein
MITAASRLVCNVSIGRLAPQLKPSEPLVYHMLGPIPSAVLRILLSALSRLKLPLLSRQPTKCKRSICAVSHHTSSKLLWKPTKMLVLAALRTCRCSTGLLLKEVPLRLLCDPVEPCVLQHTRQSVQNGHVHKLLCN